MKNVKSILIECAFAVILSVVVLTEAQQTIQLSPNYNLTYLVNANSTSILFTTTVRTTGWIGLGINPSRGDMNGADIFFGGVDANKAVYHGDYYGTENTQPIVDKNTDDWKITSGTEANGITTLIFSRLLDTKDTVEDKVISNKDIYLIWAIGENDNLSYHNLDATKRGNVTINLLSAAHRMEFPLFTITLTVLAALSKNF